MVDTVTRSHSRVNLTDTIQINSLIWIKSLADDELNPSRRMVEDLATIAIAGQFGFEEKVVGNRVELLSLLESLVSAVQAGLRPMLHFDCHGSAVGGLLLKPANEFCSWEDLTKQLRGIAVHAVAVIARRKRQGLIYSIAGRQGI